MKKDGDVGILDMISPPTSSSITCFWGVCFFLGIHADFFGLLTTHRSVYIAPWNWTNKVSVGGRSCTCLVLKSPVKNSPTWQWWGIHFSETKGFNRTQRDVKVFTWEFFSQDYAGATTKKLLGRCPWNICTFWPLSCLFFLPVWDMTWFSRTMLFYSSHLRLVVWNPRGYGLNVQVVPSAGSRSTWLSKRDAEFLVAMTIFGCSPCFLGEWNT